MGLIKYFFSFFGIEMFKYTKEERKHHDRIAVRLIVLAVVAAGAYLHFLGKPEWMTGGNFPEPQVITESPRPFKAEVPLVTTEPLQEVTPQLSEVASADPKKEVAEWETECTGTCQNAAQDPKFEEIQAQVREVFERERQDALLRSNVPKD